MFGERQETKEFFLEPEFFRDLEDLNRAKTVQSMLNYLRARGSQGIP